MPRGTMPASHSPSLASLILRLTEPGAGTHGKPVEEFLRTLDEAVSAHGVALLRLREGSGEGWILAGSGLRTPGERWASPQRIPRLVEAAASRCPGKPFVVETGPFPEDPFLQEEGALSLILAGTSRGDGDLVAMALRRSPEPFTEAEAMPFAAVAGVLGLLESSCHVLERGSRDPLTGLHLYAAFQEALDRELSRARRSGGKVTLGILSLAPTDPGKGGRLAVVAAEVFRKQLRKFDSLARYSAAEFAFLLPDIAGEDGRAASTRFLEELSPVLEKEELEATLCIGISFYPEDGSTAERLTEMAEAALNRGREAGRTGVYRWEERDPAPLP